VRDLVIEIIHRRGRRRRVPQAGRNGNKGPGIIKIKSTQKKIHHYITSIHISAFQSDAACRRDRHKPGGAMDTNLWETNSIGCLIFRTKSIQERARPRDRAKESQRDAARRHWAEEAVEPRKNSGLGRSCARARTGQKERTAAKGKFEQRTTRLAGLYRAQRDIEAGGDRELYQRGERKKVKRLACPQSSGRQILQQKQIERKRRERGKMPPQHHPLRRHIQKN